MNKKKTMMKKRYKKEKCAQSGEVACEGQLASLLGTQEKKIKKNMKT
jgi:hypothetical protein